MTIGLAVARNKSSRANAYASHPRCCVASAFMLKGSREEAALYRCVHTVDSRVMANSFEVRSEDGPACVEHCGPETSLVSWCRLVTRRHSGLVEDTGTKWEERRSVAGGSVAASAPAGIRAVPARCVAHASADVDLMELSEALATLNAQCAHVDAWGLRVGGSAQGGPFATESEAKVLGELSVMALRERVPIATVPVWAEAVNLTPSACAEAEPATHFAYDPWRCPLIFDRSTMVRFMEEAKRNAACIVRVACARACACQKSRYADLAVLRAHEEVHGLQENGNSGCWVRAETWLALRDEEG